MIVYKATNTKNGKAYIGITAHSLNARKSSHRARALLGMSNSPFPQAIREDGFDSFNWEIIDETNSGEELAEKERYWIEYYKTNDPAYGYNVQKGGQYVKYNECSIKKQVTVKMDEELYKKIQMLSLMLGKRANDLIEEGMRYILEKYGDPKKIMKDK